MLRHIRFRNAANSPKRERCRKSRQEAAATSQCRADYERCASRRQKAATLPRPPFTEIRLFRQFVRLHAPASAVYGTPGDAGAIVAQALRTMPATSRDILLLHFYLLRAHIVRRSDYIHSSRIARRAWASRCRFQEEIALDADIRRAPGDFGISRSPLPPPVDLFLSLDDASYEVRGAGRARNSFSRRMLQAPHFYCLGLIATTHHCFTSARLFASLLIGAAGYRDKIPAITISMPPEKSPRLLLPFRQRKMNTTRATGVVF